MDNQKFEFYVELLKMKHLAQSLIDIIEKEEKAEEKENNEPPKIKF